MVAGGQSRRPGGGACDLLLGATGRDAPRRRRARAGPAPRRRLMPAKRRVLIVTGSYAPAMIADMHGAGHLAWHLPALGWEVDILCPDTSYQPPSCLDHEGAAFFAPDTPVHRAPQRMGALFRTLGIGSIGVRAALPAWRTGQRLWRDRRYDLVTFSPAQ